MRPGLSITLALIASPAIASAADDDPLKPFVSSRASLTSYVGSGSFVSNRNSDDPLFSQALSLQPTYALSERFSLNAGFSVECELTDPDRRNGRRCAAGDPSLSLSANYEDLRGSFATYFPVSHESRFNNTIVNLRASAGYLVHFFEDRLSAGLGVSVQKYLPSRHTRGPSGTDTSGDFPRFFVRQSALDDLAPGSGGPLNDNWGFTTSANLGWKLNDQLAVSTGFGIYNFIRYSVPDDAFSHDGLPLAGRADFTSGTLELSWSPLAHFGLDFGVTSTQPALTADGKSLRFPFYDFISPSNNFTRWYLSAHLTY